MNVVKIVMAVVLLGIAGPLVGGYKSITVGLIGCGCLALGFILLIWGYIKYLQGKYN